MFFFSGITCTFSYDWHNFSYLPNPGDGSHDLNGHHRGLGEAVSRVLVLVHVVSQDVGLAKGQVVEHLERGQGRGLSRQGLAQLGNGLLQKLQGKWNER